MISICFFASRPITVWCSSTLFLMEPSANLVSSRLSASATASLMAMPMLPGESGFSARIFRPASVRCVGEANTWAPQLCISDLR